MSFDSFGTIPIQINQLPIQYKNQNFYLENVQIEKIEKS